MSALTEVILFVGGPADGQRLTIDAGKDSWEVMTARELGARLADYGVAEVAFTKTRYRRQQTPGGHVMIAVGIGVNELIRLLIQHYTPGLARIEGPLFAAWSHGYRVHGVAEKPDNGDSINAALSKGSNRAVVVFQARR